jgi:acetoin utilization protein AcuB
VNDGGNLVGILSDRDVKQSWASPATSLSTHELNYLLDRITVGDVMIRKLITVTPAVTIERAARLMQEHRISALPVLEDEDGRLTGIITSTDVMGVLLEAIGIDTDSTRLTIIVNDRVGFIADVSGLLREADIPIRSIFSWPETRHDGVYQLVIRVPARDGDRAIARLREAGFPVLTDYVRDISAHLAPPRRSE